MRNKRKKKVLPMLFLIIALVFGVGAIYNSVENDSDADNITISSAKDEISTSVNDETENESAEFKESEKVSELDDEIAEIDNEDSLKNIPAFSGDEYIKLNGNIPDFQEGEKNSKEVFEIYSNLDYLGRCGVAFANICKQTMPTEERGLIGQIKPSGWHTVKYNDLIDGNYLYNRCHLIGYQLAGENDNEKNLITGTRYLNMIGMLQFENQVTAYVEETNNHVLYRVTPIFQNDNLVASGVQMEGWSVEDQGKGICFNVYCYNVQPGIIIDYATGESYEDPDYSPIVILEPLSDEDNEIDSGKRSIQDNEKIDSDYVLNQNTHKIHLPTCSSVDDMKEKNKKYYTGTIDDLIAAGYSPCQRCLSSYGSH